MEPPEFNYFNCTLEQAAEYNRKHPRYKTIIGFVDLAGSVNELRNEPAMAFAETDAPVYTFNDIRDCSVAAAEKLRPCMIKVRNEYGVALLAYNSPASVFAWLGLMRLGHVVFFISPDHTADSIANICEVFSLSALFYDPCYRTFAEQSTKVDEKWNCDTVLPIALPFDGTIKDFPGHAPVNPPDPISIDDPEGFAYAKCWAKATPDIWIYSQFNAIGVFPCLDGRDVATFSVKPLYYGATEDCLRAWTSGSMIWLFPAAKLPMTFSSLGECTSEIMKRQKTVKYKGTKPVIFPEVKYFSAPEELDVYKWIKETEKGYAFARGLDFVRHGDLNSEVLHQLDLPLPFKIESLRRDKGEEESDRRMPKLLSAKRSREPDGSKSPAKKRLRPADGRG